MNSFLFVFAIVLAILSAIFGLIAEAVHYRDGQGLHVGHIARAFTIPLLIITIMIASRARSRRQ